MGKGDYYVRVLNVDTDEVLIEYNSKQLNKIKTQKYI